VGGQSPRTACIQLGSCVGDGVAQHCAVVTETNIFGVDHRGYIYITDRQNTGLHIVELRDPARKIADFNEAEGSADQR
jgi:hypothetical protein